MSHHACIVLSSSNTITLGHWHLGRLRTKSKISRRSGGVERAAKYRIHQDHWILKDLLVFRALRASVVPLSENRFYFLKNLTISLVGESRGLRLLSYYQMDLFYGRILLWTASTDPNLYQSTIFQKSSYLRFASCISITIIWGTNFWKVHLI